MPKIRTPQVAGSFYPAHEKQLLQEIEALLAQKHVGNFQNIQTIIAPHAGYVYSGGTAAAAYKTVTGRSYDNVILIAPSHYEYFEGCSIFQGNYKTPLGQIETQVDLATEIISQSKNIFFSEIGHHQEHALEVQLPFLQVVLKSFRLIPVVMGNQNYSNAQNLAQSIVSALNDPQFAGQSNLIVCSSDLSHFYNVEKATILDNVVIDGIRAHNAEKLYNDIIAKKGEACGFGPIMAGMLASKELGAVNSKILDYSTSSDVTKDYNQVVGYVSAILYREEV